MMSKRGQLLLKLGRTLNCNLGCFGMGLVMALTSVALLDLAEIYESDVKTVSHFITIRCVAELLGSLIGGKLYDTYNTQVITILTMLMAFGTVLMIPISGTLALALAMVFIGGLSFGAFDTGANVWTIRLWPENSSPALQVYHLSFGIGSLAAPLLAEPFLSMYASSSSKPLDANFNDTAYFLNNDSLHTWNETQNAASKDSRIQYAFGIASGFYLIPLVSMIALYLVDNSDFKLQETTPTEVSSGKKEAADNARFTRVLLMLLWTYVCVYVALECTTGQMLTAYAVKCDLHLSKSSASHLTAVYFSSFAASRIMAAIVTLKVTSFQMLVVSHVILAVTATLLLIWGSSLEIVLWVCVSLLGVGKGPVYGAIVAWTASYMEMSNRMMSLIIVAAVVGAMSPPLLVGQFLDYHPPAYLYVCFATAWLSIILFVVMVLVVRKRPTGTTEESKCNTESPEIGTDVVSL
ncbi:sodium-dependent glucose transporter 1C-like [Ixodes scapularis]